MRDILEGRDRRINTLLTLYQGHNCANFKLNWERAFVHRICLKSVQLLSGLNIHFSLLILEGKPKQLYLIKDRVRIVLLLLSLKETCELESVIILESRAASH